MNQDIYQFSLDSEINDLKRIDCLSKAAPYTFGNGENIAFKKGLTFRQLQQGHPTWDAQAAVQGVNRLLEIARSGQEVLLDLDAPEAKLLYFPARKEKRPEGKRPYIVLAAGGGYFGVCSLVESMPAAAFLNDLGFDVFCLNYRCGKLKLMPKPLEDMASAIRLVRKMANSLGLDPERYIVGGFSAGGHLAGMWGTESRGYRHYQLPKPEAVWLCYPMVSAELKEKTGVLSTLIVKKLMFGLFSGKQDSKAWALDCQISSEYPATYLVMAKDDDTIPQALYEDLKKALKRYQVPSQIRHVSTGGHGFGLGIGTETEGWIIEAIEFWQQAVNIQ
jgi:acetyl esterase/lipase